MKILVSNTSYLQVGWSKALQELKHNVTLWDMKTPAFDIFDECEPDILLIHATDINRALFKCILHRKTKLKLFIWLNNYNPYCEYLNIASDAERETVVYLQEQLKEPILGLAPVTNDWSVTTHLWWIIRPKIKIRTALPAASLQAGKFDESLESDICYYGLPMPSANSYIYPYVNFYKYKVFSPEPTDWPIPYYYGYINNSRLADAYASSRFCLNLLENRHDWEMNENIFNILAAGGIPLTELSATISTIFKDTSTLFLYNKNYLPTALDEPKPTLDERQKGRDFINANHRYIHRVQEALSGVL